MGAGELKPPRSRSYGVYTSPQAASLQPKKIVHLRMSVILDKQKMQAQLQAHLSKLGIQDNIVVELISFSDHEPYSSSNLLFWHWDGDE
jgi:hypothetical protein